MRCRHWRALALVPALWLGPPAHAQRPLSWQQVVERFQRNNPNLIVQRTAVDQARTGEITAGLRPNPVVSFTIDQWNLFQTNPFRPFAQAQTISSISQLIERRGKRPLRVESATLAVAISSSDLSDLERRLLFNLRDAFVRLLQGKNILDLARDNLDNYDRVIAVNERRLQAGDLARADFDRIALQRAQFESDLQTALVNVTTAKIDLRSLMNETVSLDQFDITGRFDFGQEILIPEELHSIALESRGDIRSAATAVRKAEVDHKLAWANGSWDPAVGGDFTRLGPANTVGIGISLPLRFFDRNQGEKARASLELRRSQQAREATVVAAFRDIDAAYAQIESIRAVLRPYRDTYLPQAARVRDAVSYSYSRGSASLLDFLDAQKAYRDTQLNYRNLIGSYLSAVNQLNLAVGREVLQ